MVLQRFRSTVALLCALGAIPGLAHAALVVDTGTPTNAVGEGWAFNSTRSYGGQFTLASGSTIDAIQGYFSTSAGSVTISLFTNGDDGDGGFIPGTALYSTTLNTSPGNLAWNGASGLDWNVGAGTYWAVFSASYDAGSQSSMPGIAPQPLDGYALTQGGQWYDAADLALGQGLRVEATAVARAAAVPEPGSMALVGLGLAGAGMLRRRQSVQGRVKPSAAA